MGVIGSLAVGGLVALALGSLATWARVGELRRMRRAIDVRRREDELGGAAARLRHPVVDLTRCLGCGACVRACPEEGVLELVHGQAAVVRAARCVGHAHCETACPTGAVAVEVVDRHARDDVPALTPELEAVGAPGLFLAGEVTTAALIAGAVDQGVAVAAEVARRVAADDEEGGSALDLCVVGAGPAGLACALEARRRGLRCTTLDREEDVGGTVARYPRRKLVLTRPLELPLAGRLARTEFEKEELVELWRAVARDAELPFVGDAELLGVRRGPGGAYEVHTTQGVHRARHVCLALGRRGVPRRLGVPGEGLTKVAYGLLDAASHAGRRVLVVGGGDAAVEAALALAEQPGTRVTLSYRKRAFFRLRGRSEARLAEARARGSVAVLLGSRVVAIHPDLVELEVEGATRALRNDDVLVLIGGEPPFPLLRRAGVSFDPALHDPPAPIGEQGSGLVRAAAVGLVFALAAAVWALVHADYYRLPLVERPAHAAHDLLRPGRGLGLALGLAAAALVLGNLAYLLRRAPWFPLRRGALTSWMTAHVATGVLALLCALLHAAFAPSDSAGGHAFWALAALFASGVVGRYLYAYVPRAANGRELELAEVRARLAEARPAPDGATTEGTGRFRSRAHAEVVALAEARQWGASFPRRLAALLAGERELHAVRRRLFAEARATGVPQEEARDALRLAVRAHRSALAAAHFEDLRALLGTWRWVHRWMCVLLLLLIAVHVVAALLYGGLLREGAG